MIWPRARRKKNSQVVAWGRKEKRIALPCPISHPAAALRGLCGSFLGLTEAKRDAEVASLLPRVLTLLPALSRSRTGEICLHHQALPFPNSP